MSKFEKRNITLRKITFTEVPVEDLTEGELNEIIAQIEEDAENISSRRNLVSNVHLFAYVLLNYAMRLYKIEHLEKTKQKAEEKRLDETIKRLEDFLKDN